jgi:hypothetical protein
LQSLNKTIYYETDHHCYYYSFHHASMLLVTTAHGNGMSRY